MIRRVVPFADLHVAVGAPDNVGDGINLGSSVGASLSDAERDSAYWVPVSEWTKRDGTTATFPHLVSDRAKPGINAVNVDGQRFVNEAHSSHDFVRSMHAVAIGRKRSPAYRKDRKRGREGRGG